jgi:hypothetical protein
MHTAGLTDCEVSWRRGTARSECLHAQGERGAQDMNCNCANLGSHEDRRLTRVRGMVFTCVLSLLIRLAGTYVCYLQAVDCA